MSDLREEQVEFWRQESYNYFQRNYQGKNLRDLPLSSHLEPVLTYYPLSLEEGSILEIGCGAANNLFNIHCKFKARRSVGTEVSPDVVDILKKAYPEMEFHTSDTRLLPFTSGEFDLVVLRSVLQWIDRNYFLQALGEALRVSSKYLIISDFSPNIPYGVSYHHKPDFTTFKINCAPLLEASGLVRCLASWFFNDGDEWRAVRTSLFRKLSLEEAFPLRELSSPPSLNNKVK